MLHSSQSHSQQNHNNVNRYWYTFT